MPPVESKVSATMLMTSRARAIAYFAPQVVVNRLNEDETENVPKKSLLLEKKFESVPEK